MPEGSVEGKDVLIIDDIADTGGSIRRAEEYVQERDPGEVRTATLQLLGAADGAAGVGDVVDDQDVLPLDAPLGHRVADGGFAGLLGGAHVVFHLQARQVVQPEEVTDTAAGEPATAGEGDDHVGLELGGLHVVGDLPAEVVDVVPVRDGALEVVRQVAHVARDAVPEVKWCVSWRPNYVPALRRATYGGTPRPVRRLRPRQPHHPGHRTRPRGP
jgi:hypothetical protein